MLTNLIASVVTCLLTNSTDVFPTHSVSDPMPTGQDGFYYAIYKCHQEPDLNPTHKTVVTEVKEVTTYEFKALNQKIVTEKLVSRREDEYELKTTADWIKKN